MIQISTVCVTGGGSTEYIDPPNNCPLCHHAIEAVPTGLAVHCISKERLPRPEDLQVVFRCPRIECHCLFIAYYDPAGATAQNMGGYGYWQLVRLGPQSHRARTFETEISTVSPSFVLIYNQSAAAQSIGLDLLCGPGYRKALEFLIKDFLKSLHPNNPAKHAEIENTQLGACIANHVQDAKLRLTASRATWLGNDETHYLKKWADKDVGDLKKLIELTLHWVSVEILTGDLERSMPDPKTTAVKAPKKGDS